MKLSIFIQYAETLLPFLAVIVVTALIIFLTPVRYTDIFEPSVYDVDSKTIYAQIQAHPDQFVFIDVRPEDVYRRLHAEGSQSMPLHTLYDERLKLPKDKTIILICSGGRASGVGYSYLQHYGFTKIARVHGGIEQWVLDGLPVVKE